MNLSTFSNTNSNTYSKIISIQVHQH